MFVEGTDKKSAAYSESSEEDYRVPAAITDTGCEREINEDRYAVIESPTGLAWVVCDGMGGVAGGELAAQLAIDAVRRDLANVAVTRTPEEILRNAIIEANRIIVLRRQNQAFSQMGTTMVCSLFTGAEVVICHVGDSRAYLIRDGAIQQLTVDHTFVQELVDRGQIKADEALSHPQAHILTKCIGAEPGLDVEPKKYWIWQVAEGEPGDYLLMCTDGLYSLVTEGEIANAVAQNPPQRACVKLVELAKSRGGYDNITLAVVPLMGQLKSQPPIGYEEKSARKKAVQERANVAGRARSKGFLKIILVLLLLSLLMALCTVAIFAYWVSH